MNENDLDQMISEAEALAPTPEAAAETRRTIDEVVGEAMLARAGHADEILARLEKMASALPASSPLHDILLEAKRMAESFREDS